ncbi:MAG: hypothetical protein AB7E36_16425 [Salinivirgaceae bacterium]
MRQIRKLPIVLNLVGIFSFPIFFQSLHALTHHSHSETICCEHTHHKFNPNFEQTETVCPILAYELTTMDLILDWQFPLHSKVLGFVPIQKYRNPDKQAFIRSYALRAPPLLPV